MQPYPMMPEPKKGMPTWLVVTLVVVGLVVVLFGTMGVLAIFGMRKYLAAAKSAEALSSIRQIAISAETNYDPAHGPEALCASASSRVSSLLSSTTGCAPESSVSDK